MAIRRKFSSFSGKARSRFAGHLPFSIFLIWVVTVMVLYILMLGRRGGIW